MWIRVVRSFDLMFIFLTWVFEHRWGVVLWDLTPLSTLFQYMVAVSFIGGGHRNTRRKPPTQLTGKNYHMVLCRIHLAWAWYELTTLVVICTDCIAIFKSHNHTITTTMDPRAQMDGCANTTQIFLQSECCCYLCHGNAVIICVLWMLLLFAY